MILLIIIVGPAVLSPHCLDLKSPGLFLGIIGRGVPPGSPNLYRISDQKMFLSNTRLPDLAFKIIPIFITWPVNSLLSSCSMAR